MPISWLSPLGAAAQNKCPGHLRSGILGISKGAPMPALEHAALNCFYEVGTDVLNKVAGFLSVDVEGGQFDLLASLICSILELPKEDPEVAEILAIRSLRTHIRLSDLLAGEVVDQVLDESDKTEFLEEEKKHATAKTAREVYTARLREWRLKVTKVPGSRCGRVGATSASSLPPGAGRHRRRGSQKAPWPESRRKP